MNTQHHDQHLLESECIIKTHQCFSQEWHFIKLYILYISCILDVTTVSLVPCAESNHANTLCPHRVRHTTITDAKGQCDDKGAKIFQKVV